MPGQGEHRRVALPVVVAQRPGQPFRNAPFHLRRRQLRQRAVRRHREPPQGNERRHVRLVGARVVENTFQRLINGCKTFAQAQISCRPRLRRQDAARFQPGPGDVVILLGIEEIRRAALQRVHQVHYHHIVLLAVGFQILAGISMNHRGPGVVKSALVMPGQMFPAQRHHLLVQVNHRNPRHRAMRQRLPQRAAFAAAADKNIPRLRVQQQRRMHQRLVVDMLVPLRGLRLAVQQQAAAIDLRAHHLNALVAGMPRIQHLVDLQHNRQVGHYRFNHPLAGDFFHRIAGHDANLSVVCDEIERGGFQPGSSVLTIPSVPKSGASFCRRPFRARRVRRGCAPPAVAQCGCRWARAGFA